MLSPFIDCTILLNSLDDQPPDSGVPAIIPPNQIAPDQYLGQEDTYARAQSSNSLAGAALGSATSISKEM
jgi:hypothetical protein